MTLRNRRRNRKFRAHHPNGFTALTLALLLTTALQVRFGLAPLARISEGLAAIRSGRAERLQGKFPVEIAPLARETNALIDANREIVERARTHVGNLAHALKTPLSVIVNEAAARGNDPLAYKVLEQTDIMRDQVARQLERARLAARSTVVGTSVEVPPVVTALARTMEKLYRARDIAIDVDVPDHARFRGEQQDLEEMVGNLVDNGCKWAQSRVAIEVMADQLPSDGAKSRVRIIVDDDGPGVSPAEREQVALRGQRLDETKPGSGLGLSIVVELAGLYGGVLTLGTAPIGGLRAEAPRYRADNVAELTSPQFLRRDPRPVAECLEFRPNDRGMDFFDPAKVAKPQSVRRSHFLGRRCSHSGRYARQRARDVRPEWSNANHPGIRILPSGSLMSFQTFHSCSWRGLAASKE